MSVDAAPPVPESPPTADRRLLRLHRTLSDGRLHRGAGLARALGVSERTLYRDIDRLRAAGVPVEGRRGEGYRLSDRVTVAPLDLTPAEWEALELAVRLLGEAADPEMREAARSLSEKLGHGREGLSAPTGRAALAHRYLTPLRAAIAARQKMEISAGGATRVIRPLALDYRFRDWVLVGWSDTDDKFADIRLADIRRATPLPELFLDEPGRGLDDYRG